MYIALVNELFIAIKNEYYIFYFLYLVKILKNEDTFFDLQFIISIFVC